MLGFTPLAATPLADSGVRQYNLSVDSGSFSLVGQDIALTIRDNFIVDDGGFNLNVQDAIVTAQLNIDADAGAFTASLEDAELSRIYALVADSTSYTLTLQGVSVVTSINSQTGEFAVGGQETNFTTTVPVTSGSFVLGAEDVALDINYYLLGDAGSFTLTGQDNTLIYGKVLPAEAGNFVFTADDARLEPELTLPAGAGVFSLIGQSNGFNHALEVDEGTFVVTYYGADIYRASTRRAVFITSNSTNQALVQSTANHAVLDGNYNKVA